MRTSAKYLAIAGLLSPFIAHAQNSVPVLSRDFSIQTIAQECHYEYFDNGDCPDVPGGSLCAQQVVCSSQRLSDFYQTIHTLIPSNKLLKWTESRDSLNSLEPLIKVRVYYVN